MKKKRISKRYLVFEFFSLILFLPCCGAWGFPVPGLAIKDPKKSVQPSANLSPGAPYAVGELFFLKWNESDQMLINDYLMKDSEQVR